MYIALDVNPTVKTCPPMDPEGTAFEIDESLLVSMMTEPPDVVVLPIVKPVSVTVTETLAASVADAVVMTMEVAPGAAADRTAPPDTAAEGVGLAAKKPDG